MDLSDPLGYKLLVGRIVCSSCLCVSLCILGYVMKAASYSGSKWSSAQHSNKQIVTGNKQIDVCCLHKHMFTEEQFWPRVECFKFRVPFHLLWSHGWMQASLKALPVLSVFRSYLGTTWVWNCTLKPGAKESSSHTCSICIFTAGTLSKQRSVRKNINHRKCIPQVTFWEASTTKILTETTEIGQLQRCYEATFVLEE